MILYTKGAVPLSERWFQASATARTSVLLSSVTVTYFTAVNMVYCWWILCLLFTLCKCNEQLNCNNRGSAKSATIRLKLDLLCDYDKYVRPVQYHTNKTTIGFLIAPRIINFNDHESTLHIKTWLSMHWKDDHLTWNKLEHEDIDHINLDTSMVWVPDMSVYNSKVEVSTEQMVEPVMVDWQGRVYAFMAPELEGHCVPDWSNWPFDIHTCTITLGSRRYLGSTVDFKFIGGTNGLLMKYLLPNKDWELIATNTTRNETQLGPKNDTDSIFLVSLNYQFTLRRHASVFIASYLIPGLVMMVLSLGLLWLPSQAMERTAILCTLVITQSLFLQFIAYQIPSNGDKVPFLVCYFRDCLALTGLLVIETLVTRSMTSWNTSPAYLQTVFQVVGGNKVLQFILVSDLDPKSAARLMESGDDEGSTLVSVDENVLKWQTFVNIVNRACFVLLVPIYLLLSINLMPLNFTVSIQ